MRESQQPATVNSLRVTSDPVKKDICAVWLRLMKGDENALLIIYDHSYDILYAYGCRISKNTVAVEDCIHDIFLELWEKKERLPEVKFVRAYLMKIMKRKVLKMHAHDEICDFEDFRPDLIAESKEETIISEEIHHSICARLKLAMSKLTKRQREIINLKFFTELSYDEIAAFTGLSQQRIYNLAHDAVRELRTSLRSIPRHVAILFTVLSIF